MESATEGLSRFSGSFQMEIPEIAINFCQHARLPFPNRPLYIAASMEHGRKPRDKDMHIWVPYL